MSEKTVQKSLAVIMACHNRRESTLSCLKALKKQKNIPDLSVEVYLLDDESTDGTSETVSTEFPDTHIIKGDGDLFWNQGMHKSFSAAIHRGYDYYLWLNDDSILYEHALEGLLTTSEQLENRGYDCAIIGSAMQDQVTGEFTYGGVKRHKRRWGRMTIERIAPGDKAIQCDASNGNCVLIPATVVRKVGNLDPIYQHRWGDHDYCFRALEHGCSVWLAPGYMGTCKSNPIQGTWEDINLPMRERFRELNNPRGFQFHDYAIYLRRHRGSLWPVHLVWPYFKIVFQAIKH
jgi:GT2 family glycosyltransferase